jgi:hypothetical protein
MDQLKKSGGQWRRKNALDVETKGGISRWRISDGNATILDSRLCIFTANFRSCSGIGGGGASCPGRIGNRTSVHDHCVKEHIRQ